MFFKEKKIYMTALFRRPQHWPLFSMLTFFLNKIDDYSSYFHGSYNKFLCNFSFTYAVYLSLFDFSSPFTTHHLTLLFLYHFS